MDGLISDLQILIKQPTSVPEKKQGFDDMHVLLLVS
jgi:hypothetical protein